MVNIENIYIIIPAWNEASVIGKVISDLKQHGFGHICVIDDGSTDQTGPIARSNGAKVKRHPINRGAGAATQTGIRAARKYHWPYIVFIDADGQHYPEDIHKLMDKMNDAQPDIVIGDRFGDQSSDIPRIRIFYNGVANLLTNIFCKTKYNDTQSGLRLLNRKAIETLDLRVDGFGFCSEMIIVAEHQKLKIAETPIDVIYSDYSVSKGQSLTTGISTAFHFIWNIVFK